MRLTSLWERCSWCSTSCFFLLRLPVAGSITCSRVVQVRSKPSSSVAPSMPRSLRPSRSITSMVSPSNLAYWRSVRSGAVRPAEPTSSSKSSLCRTDFELEVLLVAVEMFIDILVECCALVEGDHFVVVESNNDLVVAAYCNVDEVTLAFTGQKELIDQIDDFLFLNHVDVLL